VAILRDVKSLRLDVRGGYELLSLDKNAILENTDDSLHGGVSPSYGGIKLGWTDYGASSILIRPKENGALYVNKRRFKGELLITKTEQNKLLAVNRVGVEEYLKGVLYHEISHRWPMEAIKAQGIVARTYALYLARGRKDKLYDLTCDVYSQMYGGATSERRRLSRAVIKTKGLVLKYNGDIFPAYYHSTCGGHTEAASELWGVEVEPLKGVPCEFCKKSRHYAWRAESALDALTQKLLQRGVNAKGLSAIEAGQRNGSGRITKLFLKGIEGNVEISAKDFREAVGTKLIRSTNFTVSVKDGAARFDGVGWGHGVGLCQWGAYFMAKEGKSVQQILSYYYPGSRVEGVGSRVNVNDQPSTLTPIP